jgi:peptide/nickel transport system substrate-binding protein
VIFEAFKAGETVGLPRRTNPAKWLTNYDFPAVTLRARWSRPKSRTSRPSGIEGLVFNTRRPIFADWRVREALILAFNFEFINQPR